MTSFHKVAMAGIRLYSERVNFVKTELCQVVVVSIWNGILFLPESYPCPKCLKIKQFWIISREAALSGFRCI